jgi:Bax protein
MPEMIRNCRALAIPLALGLALALSPCWATAVLAGEKPGSETGSPPALWEAPAAERSIQLPDFTEFQDLRTRKLRFFGFLLPLVQAENQRLAQVRQRLEFIHDHVRFQQDIPAYDRSWLELVAVKFGVETVDPEDAGFWRLIRLRVDVVPENLVLVQAAMESAWGTSRFARQGNNLFGQWCFCPGCGLVPADRPAGKDYEVARFDSVVESVASYMRNLNTGRTYRKLREIRGGLRNEGQIPDPAAIADGLMYYSERGSSYIDEIQSMLRHNAQVINEARGLIASES